MNLSYSRFTLVVPLLSLLVIQALNAQTQWVVYPGNTAPLPGSGKHLVLVSGDEEYRSEEALPQLGKILAQHHGFTCTVLFALDDNGIINPNNRHNIPGLQALETADLMIIATRFRDLPDEQMKRMDDYLRSGRPVLGLRTATHAFNVQDDKTYAHYKNSYQGERKPWTGGFGRLVLGEKWISHHGWHKHQSTRGLIAKGAEDHPIVRGIRDGDVWGPTDVYGVRLPLPDDSQPLIMGQVLQGMSPDDQPATTNSRGDANPNDPMMPVAWSKSYQLPDGKRGRVFTTTMGSSTDLLSAGVRRMIVNGVYWCVNLQEKIPAGGTQVELVGEYQPSPYGFHREPGYWQQKGLRPSDFRLTQVADPIEADYLVRGASIYDGSGQPAVIGDVAIQGDSIVAVGSFDVRGQPRVIDAAGLVVAPGFIDLHSHSDRNITKQETRSNINFLKQGATTIVTGNCGSGPVDAGSYFAKIDEHGAGTNVIHLIPQGSLRRAVLGSANRPPSDDELKEMKKLAQRAMEAGAWGMSTGLIYVPSSYASTDELVELAKVVGVGGGIYATHMRNESTQLLESIQEALEIGQRADVPVHISHFKVSGPHVWGLAPDAIQMIQDARNKGQAVTADQYPYAASSTSLSAMVIPAKYRSKDALLEVLEDEEAWPAVRQRIEQNLERRGKGARLFVASYQKDRPMQGKNLSQIAKEREISVLDLVIEIQKNGGASMVNFGMSEEEVRLIMQQPFVATASDGSARVITASTVPHPRSYGCFPRKIGRYAIAGKTISIEHAVRSASGLPADILRLPRRGYVKPAYYADIVVLDPETFRDTATFERPHQYATGVRYLFVNGKLAIQDGRYTGELHGRALRHRS